MDQLKPDRETTLAALQVAGAAPEAAAAALPAMAAAIKRYRTEKAMAPAPSPGEEKKSIKQRLRGGLSIEAIQKKARPCERYWLRVARDVAAEHGDDPTDKAALLAALDRIKHRTDTHDPPLLNLLLALLDVFHEATGKPPSQWYDRVNQRDRSNALPFVELTCRAAGIEVSTNRIIEAVEMWRVISKMADL